MMNIRSVILSLAMLFSTATQAVEITVFAASSLTNVLQEIGHAYEQRFPMDKLRFSFASSSTLAKQIEQDAPVDLFLSADQKWLDYLQTKQPEKVKSAQILLKNDLVLIAPKESELPPSELQAVDFAKILADSYLAVGDPAHVPAGIYAKQALAHYQLWDVVQPKLALAKNVRDALSFVERGESPLGIVYATDAKISNKVKVLAVFPRESYGEVVYPVALLSEKNEAKRFLDFLKSPTATTQFEAAGFYPVP